MLFESYFNKVLQVSDEIQEIIKHSLADSKYKTSNTSIIVSVRHKNFPITATFNMVPEGSNKRLFATMGNYHSERRQTLPLKSGKSRRGIAPVPGGILTLNVANIVKEYQYNIPFYSKLQSYIAEIDEECYAFQNITQEQFAAICTALIDTSVFKNVIAHEIQHNYNPLSRNRVISSYKRKPSEQKEIKIAASHLHQQGGRRKRDAELYIRYITNDDEVNSAIAEAIAHVKSVNMDTKMFDESSPSSFINECVQYLKKINRWQYYTKSITRKVLRRLSQTFYNLRKSSQPHKSSL